MRKFSVKFVEEITTHFLFNNVFRNFAVYEIIWKHSRDRRATDDSMIQRMHFACRKN